MVPVKLFIILSLLLNSALYSFDRAQHFTEDGEIEVIPFAFKKTLMATGVTGAGNSNKRVTLIIVNEIEKTNFKSLQFQYATGNAGVSEAHFLVVNEKNIERGKNEKGEAEAGLKARIVLSLAFLQPGNERGIGGAFVPKASAVNFYAPGKKILTVEIRNDSVQKINQWNDPGNYFVKSAEQGDLPTFEVRNIVAYEKPEENKENLNSRDLRRQFQNEK